MAPNGSESLVRVGGLMTIYSLGLGLPFIVTAIALDRAQGILRRLKRRLNVLKVASGVLLIGIGILVYTGELQRMSRFGAANSAVFMYKVEECTIKGLRAACPERDRRLRVEIVTVTLAMLLTVDAYPERTILRIYLPHRGGG